MKPAAVVFDVFGTIAQIGGNRLKPYLQLFRLLKKYGREPQSDDSSIIMTSNEGMIGIAEKLGIRSLANFSDEWMNQLAAIEQDLYTELESVQLFKDTPGVIEQLQGLGIRVGLCSNLARPYSMPIINALRAHGIIMDNIFWSWQAGLIKPDPRMYAHICHSMNLAPHQILFVGDSHDCDVTGPCKFGMKSMLIDRTTPGGLAELLESILKPPIQAPQHSASLTQYVN